MRIFFRYLFTSLVFTASGKSTIAQNQESISIEVFYETLSPYGQWMYDKTYGYVWTPNEGSRFRPYYTNGYWLFTEHGCTWVSNYAWGWAPFHYGRWIYDSFYRWIWVPGTNWAPAWVVWRISGDYYGWTPLTPGISVTAAAGPSYYVPGDWWLFIRHKYLLNHDFQNRCEPSRNNVAILKLTTVNTNKHAGETANDIYLTGPRANEFATATGQQPALYVVNRMQKPGKTILTKNELSLYMPGITDKDKPAPAKFVNTAHPIGKLSALGNSAAPSKSGKATPVKRKSKPTIKK